MGLDGRVPQGSVLVVGVQQGEEARRGGPPPGGRAAGQEPGHAAGVHRAAHARQEQARARAHCAEGLRCSGPGLLWHVGAPLECCHAHARQCREVQSPDLTGACIGEVALNDRLWGCCAAMREHVIDQPSLRCSLQTSAE